MKGEVRSQKKWEVKSESRFSNFQFNKDQVMSYFQWSSICVYLDLLWRAMAICSTSAQASLSQILHLQVVRPEVIADLAWGLGV